MRFRTTRRQAVRPLLERLEARDCPAFNVYYTSTTLLVKGHPTLPFVNPGDGLQLQLQPTGTVQVREVGGGTTINYGSYKPPQNIQIVLDYDTDHDLTFNLGGGRVPSNLLINLGAGQTDVLAIHPVNLINGELGGNLTVLNGSGGELINLGQSENFGAQPLRVDGDTSFVLAANQTLLGGDYLFVNAGSELRGQLSTNEVDNVNIGESPLPGVNSGVAYVRKNLFDSGPVSKNVSKLDVFGEVDGSVSFQGTPAIDPFFSDAVTVESGALVVGNLSAALGNGNGSFGLFGTVEGNVTFTGALGNDFVNLLGTVFGSVQMDLRSGNNTVVFPGTVFGNLSIAAGNGDNDLTNINGTVGGGLTFNLGNGNNAAVVANAPGGVLTWLSGNGNDSLTLGSGLTAGSETWSINALFGSGDDVFTLAGTPPGTTQFLSGKVDGGGRITGNTFNQGANWVLVPTFVLVNFP
jgi:hypothetical protein